MWNLCHHIFIIFSLVRHNVEKYEVKNAFNMLDHLLANIIHRVIETKKPHGQWNLISSAGESKTQKTKIQRLSNYAEWEYTQVTLVSWSRYRDISRKRLYCMDGKGHSVWQWTYKTIWETFCTGKQLQIKIWGAIKIVWTLSHWEESLLRHDTFPCMLCSMCIYLLFFVCLLSVKPRCYMTLFCMGN